MKKIVDLYKSPLAIFVLLIVFTVPSFFPLLRPGFFPMQDDLQAFRIQQMDKCFADFQIPCRWVPDAGYQYGYPQFIYYPPSVYYLGEFFHLIGFQIIDAVKILFILGFVLAAITMFILLRSLFGIFPAFVGSLLYTYAPYRAVDVYVRGAMSEFWSFVFFPLIFWSLYKLIKSNKNKYLIWTAISIGLLLLTHNLMSLIFIPISAIWGIFWIVLERNWKVLPRVIFAGLLGLVLAAFFTLPVVFEKQYAHTESMLGGYFDYRQHFVDINQLFLSNHWGYGSSWLGPNDNLDLSTGTVHAAAGLLALFCAIYFYKKNRRIALLTIVLFVVDLFVLFMTHQKSSFIWDFLPPLWYLQFPWRLLANSVFILSVLSAIAIYLLKNKELKVILGVLLISLVMVMHLSFFQPSRWLEMSDQEKFSGKSWEKQLTVSIFDYLPIYAKLPPTSRAPDFPEIMDGKTNFLSYKKGSDFQIGKVVVENKANLRLPLFDFPGMVVTVDGKVVPHWHNDCRNQEFCLGLISVDVDSGEHIIEARLKNTPIRALGNLLTIGGIIILGLLFWKSRD
ncbi:MAG: YfhO family protein [Candidatus Daviesbacteria bacterium]|nr:YfhO family protein [Candidatus Daviesbacteria bacterium]